MKIKDWTEAINEMSHERLIQFAENAMGIITTIDRFQYSTPQEVFEFIYNIGENPFISKRMTLFGEILDEEVLD